VRQLKRLFIANRGEVAVRVARAAQESGITAVRCERPSARDYLDAEALTAAAVAEGCDAVHPGWGFLSESAAFAERVIAAGLTWVGPRSQVLALFGDKRRARALAEAQGVSVSAGGPVESAEAARAMLAGFGGAPGMLKAASGGGGRGMRVVTSAEEVEAAFAAAQAEAQGAFGDGALYLERLIVRARHVEVQVAGDRTGTVLALGDRECSVQRARQKLIEIAPAPNLPEATRAALADAAVRLAQAAGVDSLCTVEFLLDMDTGEYVFMEANPRLQVEHTVTEEVTGLDLVRLQLRLAAGATLAKSGLAAAPASRGAAVQARVNAESWGADGQVRASAGRLSAWGPPGGPGVRVDSAAEAGAVVSPAFDSLLAKLIARADDHAAVFARLGRALAETRVEGLETNVGLLRAVAAREEVAAGEVDTRWLEREAATLVQQITAHPGESRDPDRSLRPGRDTPDTSLLGPGFRRDERIEEGWTAARAPMAAVLVAYEVAPGDAVPQGRLVAVLEAMKMQHEVRAPASGVVRALAAAPGEALPEGAPLLWLEPAEVDAAGEAEAEETDLDRIRPDLQHVIDRHAFTLDANRPEAVAKRHKLGKRTARENLDDLFDDGSFIEYGALTIAAQRRRRKLDDLIANTPADGLVGGIGAVNGAWAAEDKARCMGIAYDYTVLAGTQGGMNHKKTDRLLGICEDQALPLVFYCEGGGGRPGDTDGTGVAGLDTPSFHALAALSGLAPRIGVASGRCFAGNAVFFGCCDITVATADSNIGLGGPAMIEGGGLGVFTPEQVGPIDVQSANGVVDVVTADEAEATAVAKQLMGYFQGFKPGWSCPDQRRLRFVVPENRLRVYEVRSAIELLVDDGSWLELRPNFGRTIITGFARLEGRPVGVVANDPKHLGGAIDSDGSDKLARHLQLCDAYRLPVVSLCDTPGFMVGPDSEVTAAVRHGSRIFVTAATMAVPVFTVVLRKGYGLGAQAMAAGGFHETAFTIAWPTGEFGGMGLEGAVRLAYRKEIAAQPTPEAQEALYRQHVDRMYEVGKATSMAQALEIDAVIDPRDTRDWILRGLKSMGPLKRRKRRFIDTW
jgi:acetyl/propionyl-CoA carboxylase alpha subunit/acetyl-CoA carboxylase carboxyltransferase component